jgi:Type II CAAX prenyl endopeptidase Rce1-like
MLPDSIQYLLFIGIAAMMFLLRLDTKRFSAAEWDTQDGDWRVWMGRLSWYGAGVALALIIFALHPQPVADLNLVLAPDGTDSLIYGLLFGAAGIVAAFVLAVLRNGRISFPAPGRYPGGVLTAVGTAFYDEWLFRGVLLGLLLTLGLPDWLAIVSAAFIYAFTVRGGTGSRGIFMLGLWLGIGLVAGVLTVVTFGIAAGFLGHAITRFALFMTMGPPERAAVEEVHRPTGGTGDHGAYVIGRRDVRRG